jgi:hypothetical protein
MSNVDLLQGVKAVLLSAFAEDHGLICGTPFGRNSTWFEAGSAQPGGFPKRPVMQLPK